MKTPGLFVKEFITPEASIPPSIPITYSVTYDFIKQVYRTMISKNRIKNIRNEFEDLEEMIAKGYNVLHGMPELFIKKHLYDEHR